MSTLKIALVSLLFSAAASGCAGHRLMRGSVVMKVGDTDAHVCLLSGEAKVGDRVQLFRHSCRQSSTSDAVAGQPRKRTVCRRETVAVGEVSQRIDEHYAVVSFPAGTQFQEGNTVEAMH
jgi:hypothetical protein